MNQPFLAVSSFDNPSHVLSKPCWNKLKRGDTTLPTLAPGTGVGPWVHLFFHLGGKGVEANNLTSARSNLLDRSRTSSTCRPSVDKNCSKRDIVTSQRQQHQQQQQAKKKQLAGSSTLAAVESPSTMVVTSAAVTTTGGTVGLETTGGETSGAKTHSHNRHVNKI